MNNTNLFFKGQLTNECVLSFCRKHWIVLVPQIAGFLTFILLIVIGFFAAGSKLLNDFISPSAYRVLALGAAIFFTYYLHRIFLQCLNYFFRLFVVTNYRIIELHKTVFLTDSRDAIDLSQIQDCVMHQRGLLQTILNYGELHIMLSAVAVEKCIQYIPNPDYHFRKINKTKREYIAKRRLEKELEDREKRGFEGTSEPEDASVRVY